MRRCTYYSVLERAVGLAGFTVENLSTTPRAQFNTKIRARLADYWAKVWAPELMRSELRYYRDAYAAGTTYAAAAQVYYATTGKYYTCILATTGHVPTNTTYWTEATSIAAYISLDQTGKTAIGEVRGVYLDDPETEANPRRLPYVLGVNGIQMLGTNVPKSAYVWFRIRCSDFKGADFSATATYGSGVTVYYSSSTTGYDGDFWISTAATSVAESPETTAAKWTRLEFPLFLRECVAHGAFADWLRLDGAGDLAAVEDDRADAKFSTEVIKLAGQGQILRSRSA